MKTRILSALVMLAALFGAASAQGAVTSVGEVTLTDNYLNGSPTGTYYVGFTVSASAFTQMTTDAVCSIYPSGSLYPVQVIHNDDGEQMYGYMTKTGVTFYIMCDQFMTNGTYRFELSEGSLSNNAGTTTSEAFSFEASVTGAASTGISVQIGQNELADKTAPYLNFSVMKGFTGAYSGKSVKIYRNGQTAPLFNMLSEDALTLVGRMSTYSNWNLTLPAGQYVTYNGWYTVEIEAETFYIASTGYTNAEPIVFEVQVTEGIDDTGTMREIIVPDPSKSLLTSSTQLKNFTVRYAGYTYDSTQEGTGSIVISKDGADFAILDNPTLSASAEAVMVSLPESAWMKTAGVYTVSIPAGRFWFRNNTTMETVPNPALEFAYTLSDPLSYTVTPASDTEVSEIKEITFNFNKKIYFNPQELVRPLIYFSNYVGLESPMGTAKLSDDRMSVTVTYPEAFTKGGVWGVKLNSDWIFCDDGEEFNEIMVHYIISNDIPYTVSPADAVTSITSATLTFPYMRGTIRQNDGLKAYFTNGTETVNAVCTKTANYDWEYPCRAFFAPEGDPIYASGEWTLVVEEGAFTFTNFDLPVTSSKIEAKLKVEGGYACTMDPASGATVTGFSDFNLNVVGAEEISLDETVLPDLTLTAMHFNVFWYSDFSVKCDAVVERDEAAHTAVVKISVKDEQELISKIAALGGSYTYNYQLSVPAGLIAVNGIEWDGGVYNYSYNLPDWVFYPASGSEVEEISAVQVSYYGKNKYDLTESGVALLVNGRESTLKGEMSAVEGSDNQWTVTFDPAIALPGEWTVSLDNNLTKEGAIKPSKVGELSYTIAGYEAPAYTFDPASGEKVSDLSSATMTCTKPLSLAKEETDVMLGEEKYGVARIASAEEGWLITFAPALSATGVATIDLAGVFEEEGYGVYAEIPALVYIVENADVASLFGEDATLFNVCTLDGRTVLRQASADSLRSLAPGIYVINGRTVILK